MARRWFRFTVGLAGLSAMAWLFASGVTPPGSAGAVLRHNQAERIDASPLFYSEVDHIGRLERAVLARRAAGTLMERPQADGESSDSEPTTSRSGR